MPVIPRLAELNLTQSAANFVARQVFILPSGEDRPTIQTKLVRTQHEGLTRRRSLSLAFKRHGRSVKKGGVSLISFYCSQRGGLA